MLPLFKIEGTIPGVGYRLPSPRLPPHPFCIQVKPGRGLGLFSKRKGEGGGGGGSGGCSGAKVSEASRESSFSGQASLLMSEASLSAGVASFQLARSLQYCLYLNSAFGRQEAKGSQPE